MDQLLLFLAGLGSSLVVTAASLLAGPAAPAVNKVGQKIVDQAANATHASKLGAEAGKAISKFITGPL